MPLGMIGRCALPPALSLTIKVPRGRARGTSFYTRHMEADYIGGRAKSTKDLSEIGFDCGYYQNAIGNYSLIPYGDCYLASFRVFGYFITTDRQEYQYTPNMVLVHPDEHIFCLLDHELNLVRRLHLAENTYYKPNEFADRKTYLEDGRMCVWDGGIYFTSSTFYTNDNRYEMMGLEVQRLTVDGDEIRARHFWNSCEAGIMGRHKNWMPIPDKPYKYISATYEHGAQMVDIRTDRFTEGGICETELYRGNTPLLRTDCGYMTITHKLVFDERKRKRYVNFLVEYNADLSVRRISKPFKLCQSNIEFVTAMLDLGNGKVLMGVTEFDEKPLALVFDLHELSNMVFGGK